ncbi:MAG: glycoside hydrolase family 31 protein [Acidobacteriaceae bacterium]
MLDQLHHEQTLPSSLGTGTLLEAVGPSAHLHVEDTKNALRVESETWRLEVTKNRWAMTLTNKQTGLTWQLLDQDPEYQGPEHQGPEPGGITWIQGTDAQKPSTLRPSTVQDVERHGNTWQMRIKIEGSTKTAGLAITVISPTVIRLSIQGAELGDDARLKLNFKGGGPFFGLGERFAEAKLDGLKTTLRPEDFLGQPGHNWTYIPVPLLYTPRGLGLYLDTGEVSIFDLSHAAQQRFSIQLGHPSVDCYFFVGEGPKQTLKDYTSLTGRTPLPPPWAFGVWICAYQGPEKVLNDARKLRQEGVPVSAIWTFDVMDKGDIMGWPLWWTGYYPHPRQFTDQLHGMGFKVLTYVHPYLRSVLDPYNLPNPSFDTGEQNGLFVLNAHGEPTGPAFEPFKDGNIDFTRPTNVDWWEQKVREILLQDNFDGWMEDYGEWVNDTDRFAAGVTGRKMANLNPLFYHRITYEIARAAKPDVVEFVRSGYAGSQGYTRVVWGGDQFPNWTQDYGLPSVVRAGITAGLSGFGVWAPDIADNGQSKELWTRWTEFGALTPIMRNHMWDKPEHAITLWYDPQTLDTFRSYAKLHVSLFPYLYTYAHEAATTGLPIMRHLMLEWPDDTKTYDADGEYLLGEKILVAPVLEEGASTRSLYLPRGTWTDYWTGNMMDGGRQVTVPAPLQHIPILIRAGSILPLIKPDTQTLAQDLAGSKYSTLTNSLTWRVFPASAPAQDTFTLYDGTVATARQDPSRIDVQVAHSPVTRHYELVLPAARKPSGVTVTGQALTELDDASYRSGKTGWWLDSGSATLHVFFSQNNFEVSIAR